MNAISKRGFVLVLTAALCLSIGAQRCFSQTTEDELFATAQRAFDDGFHDVAIRYLEQFLPAYPQSPKLSQAKLLLGECYYLKNDFNKALELFKSADSLTDNKDVLLFWTGETYLKLSDYVRAREDYRRLIKDFSDSIYIPQALYSLAWSYFDQKNYAEAKIVFQQLVTQFPHHQLSEDAFLKIAESTYNLGNYAQAIKDFENYLSQYPQNAHGSQIQLNIADAYYYMEDFVLAQSAYERAIKSPGEPKTILSAYIGKIWCEIKRKMYDQAQKTIKEAMDFAKAKDLAADDLLLAEGQMLYEKGDSSGALSAYAQLITNFPASPHRLEAYLGRGNANYSLQKFPQALEDFKFVLEHHQPDADQELVAKANLGLGWTYVKLNGLQEAVKYFRYVIDHTNSPEVRVNGLIQMADAYQEGSKFSDAIDIYGQVLNTYPQTPLADYVQYRQSIAFLKAGEVEAAQSAFENLRRNYKDSKYLENINYYLGVIAYKQSDWKSAVRDMEDFLRNLNHPSEFAPEANYILALSYLNLKQSDDALKIFQKILRLYPDEDAVAKNSDIGIAKCQFELGQIKEAVKRFKLIVYKYPKTDVDLEALIWLAQYYMKNAQYGEAVDYYSQITQDFADNPQIDEIHYELGQAYEMQGNVDQALAQYKSVSGQDPALSSKVKLAIAGIFSKEFDPQKALAAYQNIASTNVDYARDAYLKMAQLYRNSQSYEQEIETYKKALKIEPGKSGIKSAELLFDIGDTYEVMGQFPKAIDYYLKIVQQYPEQTAWVVKGYLRVAKIFEDRQDWEGAKVTYKKIIQLKTEESKYAQERLDWIKKK